MRRMLIVATVLGLGAAHAAEPSKTPSDPAEVGKVAERVMNTFSLNVGHLRDQFCGGGSQSNQAARNAEFAACLMYVLGAVDMMREWQRIDPVHALPVCVPRNARAGDLILAIQEHIEATTPWQRQQFDAATAVVAALEAKWPCQGHR